MSKVRVQLNHRTIREYLNGQHGVDERLEEEAQKRLGRAKEIAPVKSGAYRDRLHVETVRHPTRIVKRVVADVPYAMKVEADHGVLTRSL